MKSRPKLVLLIVLVACGMMGSYLARLIVAERIARRSSHIKSPDLGLIGAWLWVVGDASEIDRLPSQDKLVRQWAHTCGSHWVDCPGSRWTSLEDGLLWPEGLTPRQAKVARSFTSFGFQSGPS
jgi:hypothetical protein